MDRRDARDLEVLEWNHAALLREGLARGDVATLIILAGCAVLMELCTQGLLHGGTYNRQAVAMAACAATQRRLQARGVYDGTERRGERLMHGIAEAFARAGVPASVNGFGGMFPVAMGLTAPARRRPAFWLPTGPA